MLLEYRILEVSVSCILFHSGLPTLFPFLGRVAFMLETGRTSRMLRFILLPECHSLLDLPVWSTVSEAMFLFPILEGFLGD
mgnify:CR=1 FL=1